jgi:hypothetical protein
MAQSRVHPTGPFRKSTTNNNVSVNWYRRMDQVPKQPEALTLIGWVYLALAWLCVHSLGWNI